MTSSSKRQIRGDQWDPPRRRESHTSRHKRISVITLATAALNVLLCCHLISQTTEAQGGDGLGDLGLGNLGLGGDLGNLGGTAGGAGESLVLRVES